MTDSHFLLFLLLESILLGGAYLVYLGIEKRREKAFPKGSPGLRSGTTLEHYAQLLHAQILRTQAYLEQIGHDGDAPGGESPDAVRRRLELLQQEHTVVAQSGADEQTFWRSVGDVFAVPATLEKADAGAPPADTTMQAALQQKLDACRLRVANLEQFKEKFFDVKLRMDAGQALNLRLNTEIDKTVPREQQSPALRGAVDELQAENELLLKQLQRVQDEFGEIIRDLGEQESALSAGGHVSSLANIEKIKGNLAGSFDNLGDGVEQIRQVIVVQEQRIHELHNMVEGLQLELSEKQKLQGATDDITQQNLKLTGVIATMEEENTFLQEQISTLLSQELLKDQEFRDKLAQHAQQIKEYTGANAALEKNFADMERKYLELYTECHAGKK